MIVLHQAGSVALGAGSAEGAGAAGSPITPTTAIGWVGGSSAIDSTRQRGHRWRSSAASARRAGGWTISAIALFSASASAFTSQSITLWLARSVAPDHPLRDSLVTFYGGLASQIAANLLSAREEDIARVRGDLNDLLAAAG